MTGIDFEPTDIQPWLTCSTGGRPYGSNLLNNHSISAELYARHIGYKTFSEIDRIDLYDLNPSRQQQSHGNTSPAHSISQPNCSNKLISYRDQQVKWSVAGQRYAHRDYLIYKQQIDDLIHHCDGLTVKLERK